MFKQSTQKELERVKKERNRVEKGLESLEGAPERSEVFKKLLMGYKNQEIADDLSKKLNNVSKRVSEIYEIFGIQGDKYQKRKNLITLIKSHKPELLPPNLILPASPPRGILHSDLKRFYIERNIERELKRIFNNHESKFPLEIIQIKGARKTGKSNILFQLKDSILAKKERVVGLIDLSLKTFTNDMFHDLDKFLYQFTNYIKETFERNFIDEKNEDLFGYWESKKRAHIAPGIICTEYLQKILFPKISGQKYLFIDGIDCVFGKPIQGGFENVIRAWNEEKIKGSEEDKIIWPSIVVAYSTLAYAVHGLPNSPLANVGTEKFIEPFTKEETLLLSERYGIKIDESSVIQLLSLLGGQPELTQKAIYAICSGNLTLEELVENSISPDGIFSTYLREDLILLKENKKLEDCFKKILTGERCGDEIYEHQLQRANLIKRKDIHHAEPACELYKRYYHEHLHSS